MTGPTRRRFLGNLLGGLLGSLAAAPLLGHERAAVAEQIRPEAEWLAYAARFIAPEGRIVDTGNRGVSHSEGQGYGMLLATAYGDRRRFDQLWAWTRQALQVRGDGLFAWKWDPVLAAAADRNSAGDGDLLIAWALLRAARLWDDAGCRDDARAILVDARAKLIVGSRLGPLLLPGPQGFVRDSSVVVNPSYWVYPALSRFATEDHPSWADLARSGPALLAACRHGPSDLPPDWAEVSDTEVGPAAGFDPVFGFNAIRIPLYAVWGRPPGTDDLLKPICDFWASFDGQPAIPATVDLRTGNRAPYGLSAGGRAVAVLARFGAAAPEVAAAMLPSLGPTDDYYAATLILLTKTALLERSEP